MRTVPCVVPYYTIHCVCVVSTIPQSTSSGVSCALMEEANDTDTLQRPQQLSTDTGLGTSAVPSSCAESGLESNRWSSASNDTKSTSSNEHGLLRCEHQPRDMGTEGRRRTVNDPLETESPRTAVRLDRVKDHPSGTLFTIFKPVSLNV